MAHLPLQVYVFRDHIPPTRPDPMSLKITNQKQI